MVVGKIVRKGNFLRERKANPKTLEHQGYTEKRTVVQGDHRIIIYGKPGPIKGKFADTRTQAILHPVKEKNLKPFSLQPKERRNF